MLMDKKASNYDKKKKKYYKITVFYASFINYLFPSQSS